MVKPLLALAGAVMGILVVASGPTPPKVLLMVGITALAYFVPDILIRNYAQKRREAIKLELPNTLDQMLISVQAVSALNQQWPGRARTATGHSPTS